MSKKIEVTPKVMNMVVGARGAAGLSFSQPAGLTGILPTSHPSLVVAVGRRVEDHCAKSLSMFRGFSIPQIVMTHQSKFHFHAVGLNRTLLTSPFIHSSVGSKLFAYLLFGENYETPLKFCEEDQNPPHRT